ncbi:MAG: succinate dehydrogenase, cytochrome b556 subunit [Pseudomonadota bacterium]
MADVNRGNRPLSPHLQIYRPQLTSMSSILVRITGIACWVCAFVIVAWLIAAASSPAAFAVVNGFMGSFLGFLFKLGGTWALFYHMLGRLRHVLWDFGYCVEVPISEKLAIGMLGLATVLTLAVFVIF